MSITKRIDGASRTIRATPSAIYRALMTPEDLVAWLPPSGMSGQMQAFDARPAGHFRMVLRYDDPDMAGKSGGNEDVTEVRFGALIPDTKIVWLVDFVSDDPRFAGTMTMSWLLLPATDGTEVRIVAEDVPSGISKADHEEGLASSLANLAQFVERRRG